MRILRRLARGMWGTITFVSTRLRGELVRIGAVSVCSCGLGVCHKVELHVLGGKRAGIIVPVKSCRVSRNLSCVQRNEPQGTYGGNSPSLFLQSMGTQGAPNGRWKLRTLSASCLLSSAGQVPPRMRWENRRETVNGKTRCRQPQNSSEPGTVYDGSTELPCIVLGFLPPLAYRGTTNCVRHSRSRGQSPISGKAAKDLGALAVSTISCVELCTCRSGGGMS